MHLCNHVRRFNVYSFHLQTVHSPLFSRIFIRSLNVRIESRENWTPAHNRRLDLLARFTLAQTSASNPAWCALALLAFSFACINREAVNSLFHLCLQSQEHRDFLFRLFWICWLAYMPDERKHWICVLVSGQLAPKTISPVRRFAPSLWTIRPSLCNVTVKGM